MYMVANILILGHILLLYKSIIMFSRVINSLNKHRIKEEFTKHMLVHSVFSLLCVVSNWIFIILVVVTIYYNGISVLINYQWVRLNLMAIAFLWFVTDHFKHEEKSFYNEGYSRFLSMGRNIKY